MTVDWPWQPPSDPDQVCVGLVVPNYNGAAFLSECLESILAQDHGALRCLVMDGGSTDGSLKILENYGERVEWVSEPDAGQADAIAKGFARLPDVDLVGWLNSDDRLLPGAVRAVAEAWVENPQAVLFHGDLERIDAGGRVTAVSRSVDLSYDLLRAGRGRVLQPGSLYRREAVVRCGGVDPRFYLLMDVDLWIRLLAVGPACRLDRCLAQFREHPAAKSSAPPLRYYRETLRIAWTHERDRPLRALLRRGRNIGVHALRYLWARWLSS